jgi:hemerythrin-like domain-containing protein
MESMAYRLISQQMLLEHEVMARISDALRTAIGWTHHGDVTRKLEAVQFLTESFQRHLERMLDLEEQQGYLKLAAHSHPQRQAELDDLRAEHDRFRQQTQGALQRLAQLEASGHAELDAVLDEIMALIDRVDAHNKREMCFLQELVLEHPQDSAPLPEA